MRIQLHDNNSHLEFAPLTLTRPVGDLRMGILTNAERWKVWVKDAEISFETEEYLVDKFPSQSNAIIVNACMIPNEDVVAAVMQLKGNEELVVDGEWIAKSGTGEVLINFKGEKPLFLKQRWDIFQKNDIVLKSDFELITKGRTSVQLSSTNTIIGDHQQIFLEEGAKVEASTLNTTNGPIYIGKNAEIMEGSIVRGGLAMCEESALKLGTKIYGATTLGPHCKVGGEVSNVVFQAYSNKGHDGFLGNSIIGEWCNLGADTNTSNLKNNYGKIKTYSFRTKKQEQTELQFMGLTMGDHSKSGINTMFNTATVVGVSSNLFGADFPDKYIPSFQWGTSGETYNIEKAIESANNMMERRGLQLTQSEIAILKHIADTK